MQVTMQHAERLTLAEMREFLCASSTLSFAGTGRKQIYGLVEGVLHAQKYLGLSKKDKGIVRLYLVKISGLSVAQITRLIARWRERGVIEARASRRYRFPRRYTNDDILLLAKTGGAHEGLSAAAIRRILQKIDLRVAIVARNDLNNDQGRGRRDKLGGLVLEYSKVRDADPRGRKTHPKRRPEVKVVISAPRREQLDDADLRRAVRILPQVSLTRSRRRRIRRPVRRPFADIVRSG